LWFVILFGWSVPAGRAEWREVFAHDPAARKTFHVALQDFRNGSYDAAQQRLLGLLPAERPEDEEVVSVFVAKCLLAEKQYPQADERLADCRDKFANGRYADVFFFLSGHAAYLTHDPVRAARFYLQAYGKTEDEHLQELVLAALEPLFARWLDDAHLSGLAREVPEGPVAAEYQFHLGRRLEKRGRFTLAEKSYQEVLRQGRTTRFYSAAQERLAEMRRTKNISTRIGLLCPISGALADFGAQMRNAALLAVDAWRKNTGGSIDVVAEDTHGDPLGASAAARRLLDQGVAAVVGPLTSESAIAAANVIACADLPQVLPAASQSGLTSLSDKLYQLSYVPEAAGKRLARYAVDSLGDSTFAVLAPDDAYGRKISEAFQRAALQRGAVVFPVQYYKPGQTDFTTELMRIKRIILREQPDSAAFISSEGDTLDEQTVPVRIGGVFLPGEVEDLVAILPQLRFGNIFARLLGTDGLSDRERLGPAEEYLEGSIFASAEHRPADDKMWGRFIAAWKKRNHDEPTLVAAQTYDAVTLAASLIAGRWPTPPQTADSSALFEGASGTIEFSADRVNIRVELYGYHASRIVPAGMLPPLPADSTGQ